MNNGQPNGSMTINLGFKSLWQKVTIVGGPFAFKPDGYYGVCVRAEYDNSELPMMDAYIPIHDFDVPKPDQAQLVAATVRDCVLKSLSGKPVYVGCMGGWGRTGLFMSLIAKSLGVSDPVGFVRANYTPKAVETSAQQRYVDSFVFEPFTHKELWRAAFKRFFSFK